MLKLTWKQCKELLKNWDFNMSDCNPPVSSSRAKARAPYLILKVDKNDRVIGEVSKERAHQGKGILHRAFLAMVFNENGKLLLTQRSKFKKLWPSFWDGSVASHFKKGESLKRAVKKRIIEEISIEPKDIKYLFKFHYATPFKKVGSENEICYLFKVKVGSRVSPNSKEISAWKWRNLDDLKRSSVKYTPWFQTAIKKFI